MLSISQTSAKLKNAREAALKDRNYDSEETRQTMSQKLMDVFNGRSPYDWQLDAAESLILGLDCVVVAGTGAGKTIPFMLPLFVHDSWDKLVLIISPLNALEMDQVCFSLTVPAPCSIFTESTFIIGRRCCRASLCSGHAAMTCWAVWRGLPHWQWCESKELGRKRAGTCCQVAGERMAREELTHAIGLENLVMPRMKWGALPSRTSGGFDT